MIKYIVAALSFTLLLSGCGNDTTQENTTQENAIPGNPSALGQNQHQNFGVLESSPQNRTNQRQLGEEVRDVREMTVLADQEAVGQIQTFSQSNQKYFSLEQALDLLNMNVIKKENVLQAGYTDALIELDLATSNAQIEGKETTLTSPVLLNQNEVYVTSETLEKIIRPFASFSVNGDSLSLDLVEVEEDYGFPNEVDLEELPNTTNNTDAVSDASDLLPTSGINEVLPVVSQAKANAIIQDARRYIGVPYDFGSRSGYTRTFDCSSFTQYVFGINGIELPRVSRHQAKLGKYVPVKDLQPGDLLYFYWPGRFKSNKIVGHVGIYMGKGYMIHSVPNTAFSSDGVQITNIGNPKNGFRKYYLGAKRVQ
jgi:hypothetical protein